MPAGSSIRGDGMQHTADCSSPFRPPTVARAAVKLLACAALLAGALRLMLPGCRWSRACAAAGLVLARNALLSSVPGQNLATSMLSLCLQPTPTAGDRNATGTAIGSRSHRTCTAPDPCITTASTYSTGQSCSTTPGLLPHMLHMWGTLKRNTVSCKAKPSQSLRNTSMELCCKP